METFLFLKKNAMKFFVKKISVFDIEFAKILT